MYGRSSRRFALGCLPLGLPAGLLLGLLVGCGDDEGSGGGGSSGSTTMSVDSSTGPVMMNTAPTVAAMVDVAAACSMSGATRVRLQATRVGCVNPPPAPCTLPQIPQVVEGDGVDCPATDSPQTLRVEFSQTGRYHVEVVTLAGDEVVSAVCWGEGGEVELLIDDERLQQLPTIDVEILDGSACG